MAANQGGKRAREIAADAFGTFPSGQAASAPVNLLAVLAGNLPASCSHATRVGRAARRECEVDRSLSRPLAGM